MAGGIFDNLFSDTNFRELASAFNQAGRKLRDAFSLNRYFSDQTNGVLQQAAQLAFALHKDQLDTEHLLYCVVGTDIAERILASFNVSAADLCQYIEHNYFESQQWRKPEQFQEVNLSPNTKSVLESAWDIARGMGHPYVGAEHLLVALSMDENIASAQVLSKFGLTSNELRLQVLQLVGRGTVEVRSQTRVLDKYSRDLTALAQAGKLDPVIGRSQEVETVIEILARRKKNNPVLIGEPGVGKTAIVEALAQQIVSDAVPDMLRGRRLVELNLNSLLSGSQFRGQFEERVQGILDEVINNQHSLILFIDEIHTIVGAGSAHEGTLDAANILKPALARGELHMIGATTLNEYQKYFERDAALERRFQPVLVAEPTVTQTVGILRGLRDRLEAHHKVVITDESILSSVELADRYISNRHLPDKAIDVLDQAAAKVHITATSRPTSINELHSLLEHNRRELEFARNRQDQSRIARLEIEVRNGEKRLKEALDLWRTKMAKSSAVVNVEHVAEVVARLSGVPVTEVTVQERTKLAQLEQQIHQRVIGQEQAVEAVSNAIRLSRASLSRSKRPIATMLFIGPSGVGKTELARALAEVLFGDDQAMISLDMSEFSQQHQVARLIGAPPGYIGHDEGGQLTERVRRRPYSVLLLDEIEKAHQDAHNLLLQILEEGRLTDSRGRTVDFSNTLIIATSNVFTDIIPPSADSGGDGAEMLDEARLRQQIFDSLKPYFSAEFLNRIDDIVLFHQLSRQNMREIANIHLDRIRRDALAQNIKLAFDESLVGRLVEVGFSPHFGARELRRQIRQLVETSLAKNLLSGEVRSGDSVVVRYDAAVGRVLMSVNR
jgi:ATP-dependent Clp protease ATP-binding subunit ClpC